MRTHRAIPLLVPALLAAGCTSLGESTGGLEVLEDLAPYEARVRLTNVGDASILAAPEGFRIVGADGVVFPGAPSARSGALTPVTLAPGETTEGWVAFHVEARAVAPLKLVFEADGLKAEASLASVQ